MTSGFLYFLTVGQVIPGCEGPDLDPDQHKSSITTPQLTPETARRAARVDSQLPDPNNKRHQYLRHWSIANFENKYPELAKKQLEIMEAAISKLQGQNFTFQSNPDLKTHEQKVRYFQELQRAHYPNNKIGLDGHFGPETRAAAEAIAQDKPMSEVVKTQGNIPNEKVTDKVSEEGRKRLKFLENKLQDRNLSPVNEASDNKFHYKRDVMINGEKHFEIYDKTKKIAYYVNSETGLYAKEEKSIPSTDQSTHKIQNGTKVPATVEDAIAESQRTKSERRLQLIKNKLTGKGPEGAGEENFHFKDMGEYGYEIYDRKNKVFMYVDKDTGQYTSFKNNDGNQTVPLRLGTSVNGNKDYCSNLDQRLGIK